MSADAPQLLAIYLNDHLAGAYLGVELARRLRAGNASEPRFGEPLARLCGEIEADRETLEEVMSRNGVRRSHLKPTAAWVAEKLGRLKLNGQLKGYSPLSRQLELEGLYIGVTGKLRLWQVLEQTLGGRPKEADFGALSERAADQLRRLERLHLLAAAEALEPGHRSAA
jgi:hypothetical protein